MAEKDDTVDKALSEIKKIMDLISKHKSEALNLDLVEDINEKLDDLESKVTSFSEETDEMLLDFGMTKQRMAEVIKEVPTDIEGDEKEALRRALELKDEIMKMREEYAKEIGVPGKTTEQIEATKSSKEKKRAEKKLSKEEHRKKYKRLGSSKKWKPL